MTVRAALPIGERPVDYQMKILLTGFGPFDDIIANPTSAIVERLAAEVFIEHELTTQVLPVSFERSTAVVRQLMSKENFDIIVLLGVAGNASRFRIETLGRNIDNARIPDCDGGRPENEKIVEGGGDLLTATIDTQKLLEILLSEGFDVALSDHAGGYVCNHVYYSTLHTIIDGDLKTRCVFLHVPPAEDSFMPAKECVTVSLDVQTAFVRRALEVLVELNSG